MKLFSPLYDKVLKWSAHRYAAWYLGLLSFAESSFFPIPPDVMLAPMALAQRHKAWFYASLTTITSVLGGVLGYFIGLWAFASVEPWIIQLGYYESYLYAREGFDKWGIWVVFLAGFTPIPYKVFTISAGAASMAFIPFVLASILGRGARFFLVAGLIVLGGEKMESILKKYIDILGLLLVGLVVIAYFVYKYTG